MSKVRTRKFVQECAALRWEDVRRLSRWVAHPMTLGTARATVALNGRGYFDRTPVSLDVSWPLPSTVAVVERTCGAVGARTFMECPMCEEARTILYVPPGGMTWGCVECHRLVYPIQHQCEFEKLLDKKQALKARLERKGLWAKTRAALHDKLARVEDGIDAWIEARFAAEL